jgi:hypothetical protein
LAMKILVMVTGALSVAWGWSCGQAGAQYRRIAEAVPRRRQRSAGKTCWAENSYRQYCRHGRAAQDDPRHGRPGFSPLFAAGLAHGIVR